MRHDAQMVRPPHPYERGGMPMYDAHALRGMVTVVHIQIPPTGYVGLILRSTHVATASRSTVEGTTSSVTKG